MLVLRDEIGLSVVTYYYILLMVHIFIFFLVHSVLPITSASTTSAGSAWSRGASTAPRLGDTLSEGHCHLVL